MQVGWSQVASYASFLCVFCVCCDSAVTATALPNPSLQKPLSAATAALEQQGRFYSTKGEGKHRRPVPQTDLITPLIPLDASRPRASSPTPALLLALGRGRLGRGRLGGCGGGGGRLGGRRLRGHAGRQPLLAPHRLALAAGLVLGTARLQLVGDALLAHLLRLLLVDGLHQDALVLEHVTLNLLRIGGLGFWGCGGENAAAAGGGGVFTLCCCCCCCRCCTEPSAPAAVLQATGSPRSCPKCFADGPLQLPRSTVTHLHVERVVKVAVDLLAVAVLRSRRRSTRRRRIHSSLVGRRASRVPRRLPVLSRMKVVVGKRRVSEPRLGRYAFAVLQLLPEPSSHEVVLSPKKTPGP